MRSIEFHKYSVHLFFIMYTLSILPQTNKHLPYHEEDGALRVSLAMARAGKPLKRSSLYSADAHEDGEGNPVCVSSSDLHQVLEADVGKPKHIASQEVAMSKCGIVFFEGVPAIKGETGHFDLMKHGLTKQRDYWSEASNVWLWETKE